MPHPKLKNKHCPQCLRKGQKGPRSGGRAAGNARGDGGRPTLSGAGGKCERRTGPIDQHGLPHLEWLSNSGAFGHRCAAPWRTLWQIGQRT